MREAADRIATVHAQNALLLSHETHLHDLDRTVQAGHAAILSQLGSLDSQKKSQPRPPSNSFSHGQERRQQAYSTIRSSRKLRLTLPRWFTKTVWEFGAYGCEGGWTFQLRPINIRPYGTSAFDAVRDGNVEAVRKLLAAGELSGSDYECDLHRPVHSSLPVVSPYSMAL
jgi:hypothetical protein